MIIISKYYNINNKSDDEHNYDDYAFDEHDDHDDHEKNQKSLIKNKQSYGLSKEVGRKKSQIKSK